LEQFDITLADIKPIKHRLLNVLRSHTFKGAMLALVSLWLSPSPLAGQIIEQAGPYLAHLVEGGPSLKKVLPQFIADAPRWTEWVWFRSDYLTSDSLIAGTGDPASSYSRYFQVLKCRPGMRFSAKSSLLAPSCLRSGAWHMMAVTDDGKTATFYVDGVLAQSGPSAGGATGAEIQMSPDPPSDAMTRFSGEIGGFSVAPRSMSAAEICHMFATPPDFDAQLREENAKPWSIQTKQGIGLRAPQDPAEMPHGATPEQPRAKRLPAVGPTLRENGNHSWEIAANWRLLSNVGAGAIPPQGGAQVSTPGFDDSKWLAATVPGTVLTTMIDRGIYPDPDFGLNNLAIPESLNKHDYWYRVEFPAPRPDVAGRRRSVHFAGINYAAEVWFNGQRLGEIRGAFRRGDFDVTHLLHERQEWACRSSDAASASRHSARAIDQRRPGAGWRASGAYWMPTDMSKISFKELVQDQKSYQNKVWLLTY
jgi:hypothetical protein